MTPDDARNYFFKHLPQVRNTSDLQRLTFWVLPYLAEKPDRPLGSMETMAFRLQLEHFKYDETIQVWYFSNRDVSTQLEQLSPIYSKGSSSPHFCSGLSARMTIPNGPNFAGAGLPLGPFSREHAAVKKKLDAVQSMESWWKTFLGQTPLWLRTAYNWPKPTPEQKIVLQKAKKDMLAYVPMMARNTKGQYKHCTGRVHVSLQWPLFSKEDQTYVKAPHWNGLVAGQQFIGIKDTQEHVMEFNGLNSAIPGVVEDIKNICQLECELRGWTEMGDYLIEKAMEKAEVHRKAIRLIPEVDISYLETSTLG